MPKKPIPKKPPSKPAVHKGKVYHNDMAETILKGRSFLTLKDTGQVLLYHNHLGIYRFDGETVIKELSQTALRELGMASEATTYFVNQVVDYIRRATYIDRNQLNANSNILVVNNGVIDLTTLEVEAHSRKHRSTVKIPVTYDANAKCPNIDKFIREVVKPESIPLLYEIPAWCLVPRSRIQRLLLLLGGGWNGKTTYVEMLTEFIGRENCRAYSMQVLSTNRFAVAGLFGKLANIHDDLPAKALRDTSPLKML